MRVEDALRLAGRAGRVAERRRLALGDLRVLERRVGRVGEELLIADRVREIGRPLPHDDVARDARQAIRDRGKARRERVIDEDHAVLSVVDHVREVVGVKADVERVQDRAGAGDREVALEVALAVPGERADPLALLDAETTERVREAVDPRRDLRVGGPRRAVRGQRHDLPLARVAA